MVEAIRVVANVLGYLTPYSGNVQSQLEVVIENLVGKQGQPTGAQMHAMFLSEQKEWSQDPRLPRPHLRLAVEVRMSVWTSLPAEAF